MKKLLYITCVLTLSIVSAQKPFINSLDKKSGTPNELVTISGVGFSTPTVYFGAGKATSVTVLSSNVLEVLVPSTATYGPVMVVNSNGLSATSKELFTPAFDKDNGTNDFELPTPATGTTTGQLRSYDICMCDFDGDGLLDAAMSNQNTSTTISLIKNTTSTPGTFTFSTPLADHDFQDATGTGNYTPQFIQCGDLNGDGKPDLVVTALIPSQTVHIYSNESSGAGNFSFTKQQRLELPSFNSAQRTTGQVRIADFDGDGKLDLVVGTVTTGDQSIFIFRNNSTGAPNFVTTPIEVNFAGTNPGGIIYPGDFDQDGKIDLVIGSSTATGLLTFLRNTSLPSSISFERIGTFGNSFTRQGLVVADFNLDGLPEVASTTGSSGSIEVLRNSGSFSFTVAGTIASSGAFFPIGIDAGDMDGNGYPDLVMASLSNEVVYYENTTTGSTISFRNANTAVTFQARYLKIGDLNDDGKPDIAFVDRSTDDDNGDFRYFINNECMTPVIQPTGGIYCNGSEFLLTATAGHGVTYSWTITGDTPSPVNTGTDNTLDLSAYDQNISVTVTATSPDGCSQASTSRSFTVGGTGAASPTINNPGIICGGDVLTLTTPNNTFDNYYWFGPNGYTATTTVPTVQVASSASGIHSGSYTLIVDDGDCQSPLSLPMEVTVSSPPSTQIQYSACNAGVVTLSVPDYDALGYSVSYQWQRNSTNVGTDAPTLDDSAIGAYTVIITDVNTCDLTTAAFNLETSTFTGPTFTAPNEVCVDVQTTFTSEETGTGITNSWEIEDPAGSVTETLFGNAIDYTFTSTGSKIVRLITRYSNGVGCSEKPITVSAEPNYTVDVSAPGILKCPSESVTLSFSETDITSYTWDDVNNTTGALTATEPGTYTATYITNTGCEIVATSVTITNQPGLNLVAESPSIVDGELELAQGQTDVNLSVDIDVVNPVWSVNPTNGGIITGSGTSITFTPQAPQATVSVTGQTAEGCDETETVNITGGGPRARKSFSPNGDGTNDCWEIINSTAVTSCTVYILDTRGANVFKTDLPLATDCIWDGNFNGKAVPEGVYYYVMKCADGSNSQSGSILLAR